MPDTSRRNFLQTAAVAATALTAADLPAADPPPDLAIPDWVFGVTRMGFLSPGEVDRAAKAGVQVVHTNVVWPYFPLHKEGGGLAKDDDRKLRDLVKACHDRGMKVSLGLPPFPSVAHVEKHPDWRVDPDGTAAAAKRQARHDDLGTRLGCNLGPWGDYLIEVCAELIADYDVDGFSFDGNYHPALCRCPACKAAYPKPLPAKANLDDVAYREYLVWRGERLEDHYRRLQQRIKKTKPDAVIMSWTVNAGRYGHFLHSPRAMPTRLNRLFDLPMQEWWLDETNLGGSVAPTFGAAYLRATVGGRPCASEPYLMTRGSPYGTDSFPAHERLTRCLLAVSQGTVLAESLGWPGHDPTADFAEIKKREPYMTRLEAVPWAALLVSEQTRQFYAYKDVADRFLPHVFGAFRMGLEEHLPVTLINDWDVTADSLKRFAVLILPNAAALSDAQVAAVREYVRDGGGLVATSETSLCDDLGRPRGDFALADVFRVHYRGRPKAPLVRPKLDENFAVALDESYWKQRTGVATLTWSDHPLVCDPKLSQLVPKGSVIFRGPLVAVDEPPNSIVRMKPEGTDRSLPAINVHQFGEGRVVYSAIGLDAALWSYAYPYQRRLLARAVEWAARAPAPIRVAAPMCVQATSFTQPNRDGERVLVHLFNGVNTTANHGLPASEVPLREEVIPIHGIRVTFRKDPPTRFRCEPAARPVEIKRDGDGMTVTCPPLDVHMVLVGESA